MFLPSCDCLLSVPGHVCQAVFFELGKDSYQPIEAERVSKNRLFDMFHACTPANVKDVILKSLAKPQRIQLRVVLLQWHSTCRTITRGEEFQKFDIALFRGELSTGRTCQY